MASSVRAAAPTSAQQRPENPWHLEPYTRICSLRRANHWSSSAEAQMRQREGEGPCPSLTGRCV